MLDTIVHYQGNIIIWFTVLIPILDQQIVISACSQSDAGFPACLFDRHESFFCRASSLTHGPNVSLFLLYWLISANIRPMCTGLKTLCLTGSNSHQTGWCYLLTDCYSTDTGLFRWGLPLFLQNLQISDDSLAWWPGCVSFPRARL